MKKSNVLLIVTLLTTILITGCGSKTDTPATEPTDNTNTVTKEEAIPEEPVVSTFESVDMRITALKGPTAMGMVNMMSEVEQENITDNNYTFNIVSAIDEVPPMIAKGEVDIAAVPANLASVLYNNTEGAVEVLAVNTLGVIYIVENGETVQSVEDLRGKTIYASGKGASPEYALNYILSANNIDPTTDVTIEWKSEHAECLAALTASENAIAMLPQPFVATAQAKNDAIHVALDLTEEWDTLQADVADPSTLITGVIIGRREFVEANPEAVGAFLDHYKDSVDYVNTNNEDAAALIEYYDIVPAAIAKSALPECNITYVDGADMKTQLSGYLNVLFEQNPKAIGGTMPEEDFYFER